MKRGNKLINTEFYHQPVMINEVDNYLITEKSGYYVDCTFGGGGHSAYLLNKYPNINIIAFDQDADALKYFNNNHNIQKNRIIFCNTNFRNISEKLKSLNIQKVNGIFADLGVSSKQLDNKERGFSFNSDNVIDMRMNQKQELSAYDIVNTFDYDKLVDIFFNYGEESFSKQIAEKIVEERVKYSIKTCKQLQNIILSVKWKKGKTDPSTKIFQALRIYVNDELGSLKELLNSIPLLLNKNSRSVFLTYHSLEDRIVKTAFKNFNRQGFKIVNKKVIVASQKEIKENPRSRSAKMRVLEKQK
jgi:16S rRNA (cytosine1402-N4)-methyltransferase